MRMPTATEGYAEDPAENLFLEYCLRRRGSCHMMCRATNVGGTAHGRE